VRTPLFALASLLVALGCGGVVDLSDGPTGDDGGIDAALTDASPVDAQVDCTDSAQCATSNPCEANPGLCVAGRCTYTLLSAGTECRPAVGDCDVAEECTGASPACPDQVFRPAGTQCRDNGGACGLAENCTGDSPNCPGDQHVPAGTECRGSAGICDVAESCTGQSGDCPADNFVPAGTECRASVDVCDLADRCTGQGPGCPGDAVLPAGTGCPDDGDVCTADQCAGGTGCEHPYVGDFTTCGANGEMCCGGGCVDTWFDPNNCGGCFNVCPFGQCQFGVCDCPFPPCPVQ
jgi:hypothetical protein